MFQKDQSKGDLSFIPERTSPAIQHLAAVLGYFYPCTGRAILECIMNPWEDGESVWLFVWGFTVGVGFIVLLYDF